MKEQEFPALYRSADDLSLESQRRFFGALLGHLISLVTATTLSVVSTSHWSVAALQLIALLSALSCSIFLSAKRPDRYWYAGRAVAESIKTVTWRFVSRADPFDGDETAAKSEFRRKLKAIVDQNRDVAQSLTKYLDAPQITPAMMQMRAASLEERKANYAEERIKEQLTWYAKKASFNRQASSKFFSALITVNGLAVACAILRIRYVEARFWPTDVFVAAAASLLGWMQAKRFSELAASYALAAHEISLIREQSLLPTTDEAFSEFVGDAENAFSREHTQWVARKDA